MNKLIIAACAAMLSIGTSTIAQTTTTAVADPQVSIQDETRAVSGELKEAYGLVSQQLTQLNKEIGADATKATPEQATKRDQLKNALSKLEGMLSTVNTANEQAWPEIKAKAATVKAEALALVPVKATTK